MQNKYEYTHDESLQYHQDDILCRSCLKERLINYPNLQKLKTRVDKDIFKQIKEDLIINNLQETWLNYIEPTNNSNNTLEGCIFMMNFNSDGSILATSSVSDIDFWDMTTKKKICNVNEHKEIVTSLEWFKKPESNRFATCSLDKTIKLWDNYTCKATLRHHDDWLRCMTISNDNQYLISGCVSASVMGFNLHKMIPMFKIKHKIENNMLNTVNTVNFKNSENTFLSGTRDGYIRIFDIRTLDKPIYEIYAHNNKLNSAEFSNNDLCILSAGRDSITRLWDLRYIPKNYESLGKVITGHIREYIGHKSTGYNIASNFFANEKYIITGSEDNSIYIYKTSDAKLIRKIPTKSKIIHILKPLPYPQYGFVFSGLQENFVHLYDIHLPIEEINPTKNNGIMENKFDVEESNLKIIEEFMTEYGDLILKVFHKNNSTYTSGMTWENLLKILTQDNDEDSRELLHEFNDKLIRKMQQQFYTSNQGSSQIRDINPNSSLIDDINNKDRLANDKHKSSKKTNNICETCMTKRDFLLYKIYINPNNELTQNQELIKSLP